jgi:hypothetical protein
MEMEDSAMAGLVVVKLGFHSRAGEPSDIVQS